MPAHARRCLGAPRSTASTSAGRRPARRGAGAARNSTLPSAAAERATPWPPMTAGSRVGEARRRPRPAPGARRRGRGSTPLPSAPPRRPASNWGFTSTHQVGARPRRRATRAAAPRCSEMNDRSATTRSTGAAEAAGVEVADVGALAHRDPGVGPEPLVELAVADVDGHDLGGAALQQAVGEPAGRRAGVEGPARRRRRRRSARARPRACRRPGSRTGPAGRGRRPPRRRRPGGPACPPARRPTSHPARGTMSAWACVARGGQPRRTSSASRRRRVTVMTHPRGGTAVGRTTGGSAMARRWYRGSARSGV